VTVKELLDQGDMSGEEARGKDEGHVDTTSGREQTDDEHLNIDGRANGIGKVVGKVMRYSIFMSMPFM